MQTEKMIRIKLDIQNRQLTKLEKDFWTGKYDENFHDYSRIKDLLLTTISTLEWVLED